MQLLITPLAAFDLEEIGDYIAQDNPSRAVEFLQNCNRIAKRFFAILRGIDCVMSFQ